MNVQEQISGYVGDLAPSKAEDLQELHRARNQTVQIVAFIAEARADKHSARDASG